jgi:hypothetical protein
MITSADTPRLSPEKIKTLIGNRLLIEWELAPEDYLSGKLVRSDKHRSAYYTGIVLKKGTDCDVFVEEGDRIFFDQFSNPEQFMDDNNVQRRYAIIEVDRQGAAFAVIPPRVRVRSDEGGFDYSN